MVQNTAHHRPPHPYASVLRQRAGRLQELATAIEHALVMALDDGTLALHVSARRARLCEAMLARNLHQLHQAADDLRETAFRFRTRADEFDRATAGARSGTHPPGEAA